MLYLEDIHVGDSFNSDSYTVTEEEIINFARQYDPQPFHLDHAQAEASLFRGLAASGWHTAGITMRLLVQSELRPAGGVVGMGLDEMRWPRPVRPGDTLNVVSEVVEVRSSQSRPETGVVKVRSTTLNQRGETVQVMVSNLLVPRRSS